MFMFAQGKCEFNTFNLWTGCSTNPSPWYSKLCLQGSTKKAVMILSISFRLQNWISGTKAVSRRLDGEFKYEQIKVLREPDVTDLRFLA